MLNQRLEAARAVQTHFLAAEAAQNLAAREAANCLAAALTAQHSANLPLGTGLHALDMMAKSAVLALDARRQLIETHPVLAAIPAQIGLDKIKAWGPTDDQCVPVEPRGAEFASPPLAAVA